MSKALMPAKQIAGRYKAQREQSQRARDERVMEQLVRAVEVGVERGSVHVQIHMDDCETARRLLAAEGYVWTEPEPDLCDVQRLSGGTQTFKLDLTTWREPQIDAATADTLLEAGATRLP